MTPLLELDAVRFTRELKSSLNKRGFDLVQEFGLGTPSEALFPFYRFKRESCLALLIGNSKAAWEPFKRWHTARPAQTDPFNSFTEEIVENSISAAARSHIERTARGGTTTLMHSVYYAHVLDYDVSQPNATFKAGAVPMQRLAAHVGLAALGPAHLNAHPAFGPWFALRAVAVIDLPYRGRPTPRSAPCVDCPAPCKPALDRALEAGHSAKSDQGFSAWLKVRRACPIGAASEYSDQQIQYHYLGRQNWL